MKGSDIRDARKRKGWTQQELSAISGVHYITISKIETGLSVPKESTCRKLAVALEIPFVPPPLSEKQKAVIRKKELVDLIDSLNFVQRIRVLGYIDALLEE